MRTAILRPVLFLSILTTTISASAGWSWQATWASIVDTFNASPQNTASPAQPEAESMAASSTAPSIVTPRNGDMSKYKLPGRWNLMGERSREPLGSLSADNSFFTLVLKDPNLDLRTAYRQADNGDFVCTILDKNVVVLQGSFYDEGRIGMNIQIKSIGKADTKTYTVIAVRES